MKASSLIQSVLNHISDSIEKCCDPCSMSICANGQHIMLILSILLVRQELCEHQDLEGQ
jgi:hypothetical protein